jgi:hypothetical protein
MTNKERINMEIDNGLRHSLLELAELADEDGDTAMGAGYRWLAWNKSYPSWRPVYEGNAWYWHVTTRPGRPEDLPFKKGKDASIQEIKFQSLSEAFQAAADYVGDIM